MSLFENLDATDLDPNVFYSTVELMELVDKSLAGDLDAINGTLKVFGAELDGQAKTLEKACRRLSFETGRVTRRKGGFRMEFDDEEDRDTFDGATGDVIRKVVDFVWRGKISAFVEENPVAAEALCRWLNRDDTKFTVSEFKPEHRAEFLGLLSDHVWITPEDIDRSIQIHLDNVAIHSEIETAVATYEGARRFLQAVRESRVA